MRILFVVPYPLRKAPSQRFRVEQFFPLLEEHQIEYKVEPFFDDETWEVLYKKSSMVKKVWSVFKGFVKRIWTAFFVVPQYHYIFVHREATPVGPPFFEYIVSKILCRKLIFDFDDAIWMSNKVTPNPLVD